MHNHGPDDGAGTACREQLIGECVLSPSTESVAEAASLIRSAKMIRKSVWYEHQLVAVARGEYPTLSMVLALVDKLALYSAGDPVDGASAGG